MPRSPHAAKLVRFPPDLAAEIDALAKREYRSFTAQLVKMLREWLDAHPEARGPRPGEPPAPTRPPEPPSGP